MIQTVDCLGEMFIVKFQLYIDKLLRNNGFYNIIHLTVIDDEDDEEKGDRIPALWTHWSSLVVASEIDGVGNTNKIIEGKLVEKDWMNFEVKQRRNNGTVRLVFCHSI